MSTLLFANNATSTLSGGITNTATSVSLAPGSGVLFPNPGAGQYFVATFVDAATGLVREIVWVTAVATDTCTIVRGQEGTTAVAWLAGDIFSNLWTAGQATAMAQQGQLQTQASNYAVDSGTLNAIVATLSPVPVSLASLVGTPIRVKVANTTTATAPTLTVNGFASTVIVNPDGSALAAGQIPIGAIAEFLYNGTNFQLSNISSSGVPVGNMQGLFFNLVIANDGSTPNTKRDITANTMVLGNGITINNLAVSINSALSGAGGLDTGTLAASAVYYEWIIAQANGANPAGLMSLSSTAPTLPGGYDSALTTRAGGGAITDSSKNFLRITQKGSDAAFVITAGTNTAALPIVATGPAGSLTTPTWAGISVAGVSPSTAARIRGTLIQTSGGAGCMLAPNSAYGTRTSTTNPPPVVTNGAANQDNRQFDFMLESTNIYCAAADADEFVFISVWRDNLS